MQYNSYFVDSRLQCGDNIEGRGFIILSHTLLIRDKMSESTYQYCAQSIQLHPMIHYAPGKYQHYHPEISYFISNSCKDNIKFKRVE